MGSLDEIAQEKNQRSEVGWIKVFTGIELIMHVFQELKRLKDNDVFSSEKIGKADKVAKKIERHIIEEIDMKQLTEGEACLACEG